ncbi:LOW QUALITY PROTEIN: hypothetical protein PHMEG_00023419 [Phytophthora megakarya]|uniref:Uncharacterized protein n=1 Tax=Phytophthora megakarya TaxID=4795 RepID=A0A225VH49_9STRA|nr:LOW QUALITY PROTEIN: hypothetical protein PHMEG_00023419 [Phytophthora megakarya]
MWAMSGTKKQSVVARAFPVEIEERVKIQYTYAGIRYSGHKRYVLVQAGRNQLMEPLEIAVNGVESHEKSWCIMLEVAPGICLLQRCIGLTVNMSFLVVNSSLRYFVKR